MRRFDYDHAALFATLRELADHRIFQIAPDGGLEDLSPAGDHLDEANYVTLPPDRLEQPAPR